MITLSNVQATAMAETMEDAAKGLRGKETMAGNPELLAAFLEINAATLRRAIEAVRVVHLTGVQS